MLRAHFVVPAQPLLNLRHPLDGLDLLAAEAERRGLTRSELVRQAIVASNGEAAPAPTPEAGQ